MTWEPVPADEMPAVLAAAKDGRCVSCYGPIRPEHGGLYCCGCDDLCECADAPRITRTELAFWTLAALVLVAALVLALTVDTGPADAPADAPSGERAEPKNSQPNGLGNQKGKTDGKQGGVHPDRTREVAEGTGGRGVHGGPGVLDRSGPDPQGRLGHGAGRGLTVGFPGGTHVPSGERTDAQEGAR